MKTLIINGLIYDGSGSEPYLGDILLDNDIITKVGNDLGVEADRIIDINGKSVAPGFFDAHSHNDWFAIKKYPQKYFEPFIRQGITSFITGNCGLSTIGFNEDSENTDKLGGGLFFFDDTTGKYSCFDSFAKAIDNNTPCNIAALVGHCSARTSVAGYSSDKLSEEKEAEMLQIIEQSLQQGACGVSLGLAYEPGLYADMDELKKVAELCVRYNKPLTVHAKAYSKRSMAYPQLWGRSHGLRALDEMRKIAEETKVKLQYSHAIFVGRKSFADYPQFKKIIEEMRNTGIDVMFDIYDELWGVSVITVILPTWYQAMSKEERNKPINRLKLSILVKATSLLLGFGFKDIQVAYVGEGNEKYEGKTIHEIAQEEGISDLNAYLKMCQLSDFKGRVNQSPYATREIIDDQCKSPYVLYMTDAWVEEHGVQNVSIYNCFPKFLQDSLNGKGDNMANTVRKMSGGVADRFMIEKRGYIKEGYYADLTIFDESVLKSANRNTEESFGINKVFINGRLVLDEGSIDSEALKTSGRALSVK